MCKKYYWVIILFSFSIQPSQAISPIDSISIADFNQQVDRLKQAKSYQTNVPLGRKYYSHIGHKDNKFYYAIDVPDDYKVQNSYPLHIFLHGLISREKGRKNQSMDPYLKKMMLPNTISVFPMGWNKAMWWQSSQIDNIYEIIKIIKNTYHIDNNKIFLHGVSDGGHGVYYMAAHKPDIFAGFIPMIGSPFVLISKNNAEHETFLTNLLNKPLLIFNGSNDNLYPTKELQSFIDVLIKAGADALFVNIEGGGHNLSWYDDYQKMILNFVSQTERLSHPNKIYWEVDQQLSYPRYHWLIINKVKQTKKPKLVSITQKGNNISITGNNVNKIQLLISPQLFDMTKKIVITYKDKIIFNNYVDLSIAVLNKWYQIDQNINQVYAAEITIDLLN